MYMEVFCLVEICCMGVSFICVFRVSFSIYVGLFSEVFVLGVVFIYECLGCFFVWRIGIDVYFYIFLFVLVGGIF